MAESESGDDREGSNNILTGIVEENNRDKSKNSRVEEAPILDVEKGGDEDVQIITLSPPQNKDSYS